MEEKNVTIIDNLNLTQEERLWFERIYKIYPVPAKVSQWIQLEDMVEKIAQNLSQGEIHILVATGGIEAYRPKGGFTFILQSPNFSGPKFAMEFEEYERIIENPVKHHEKELCRLKGFLSVPAFKDKKIKVIEGDVGNGGLSMARLCAIYKIIKQENKDAEILIGAAPEGNIFSVMRRSSLILPSGNGLYQGDLRQMLDLGDVPCRIMIPCKEGYIWRASEMIGVSKSEEVDDDVLFWAEFNRSRGILTGKKLEEYVKWFRHLTLKKIERVNYINERIELLENY